MTEIQEKVIPYLLDTDIDLIGLAQTGTGKTAAFGIPLIQKAIVSDSNFASIILCPTRELCKQIATDIEDYSKYCPIKVVAVYGGEDIKRQITKIQKGYDIIVGTPGRVMDLIKRKKIIPKNFDTAVLDEADEMLNMGFRDDIEKILSKLSHHRQTLLFSATMPKEILKITNEFMNDPMMFEVAKRNEGAKNIEHICYYVSNKDKFNTLKRICDFNPNIYGIVFCRTRRECNEISDKLMNSGYNADTLNGDLSQNQRDLVMKKFRNKTVQILVATDVAARGIDVDDITHIINYSLPDDNEIYVHRSGRTARAGKKGISIVIASNRQKKKINSIERMISKDFLTDDVPSNEMIIEKQIVHMAESVILTEKNDQIDKFLTDILKKFKKFKKDDIINKFITLEFNKLLSYYNKNKDVKSEKSNNNVHDDRNMSRFHINIGKKNGLEPQYLLGIINEKLKLRNVRVGRIDIMSNFSFFDIDGNYKEDVLLKLNNTKWKKHKLKTEVAQEKKHFSKNNRRDHFKSSKKRKPRRRKR